MYKVQCNEWEQSFKILQIPDINKSLIKNSEMKELFDATREASIQLAL